MGQLLSEAGPIFLWGMKVIPENRRVNWFKAGLAVLLLALLWTTVAGWLLPRWGRAQLEQAASQALGLPVTVGQLSLQPWTLRATLKDVRVGSPEQPLLTVSSAQARVSLESLFRLAPWCAPCAFWAPRCGLNAWIRIASTSRRF